MNIMSINVCGIGDMIKRKHISQLCSEKKVSFFGLQETRVSSPDLFVLRKLWGDFSFDFALSSARGFSGGLLSIWDPAVFNCQKIASFPNVLIVKGEWVFDRVTCYMVNVYAPQQTTQKRSL